MTAVSATSYSLIPPGTAHAHAELLQRADLQFDFPKFATPEPPGWLLALFRLFGSVQPVLKYVFWAAICAGLALLLYLAARAVWRRFRPLTQPQPDARERQNDWRPEPEGARLLLHQADMLAAEGRFGDAAHLLLLRGIRDISERRPLLLRPALTSWEIGTLEQLPATPRGAFSRIAQTVERALFANRSIGADDFARCRLEYERFALPQAWLQEGAR
jgi:hypothetical protein